MLWERGQREERHEKVEQVQRGRSSTVGQRGEAERPVGATAPGSSMGLHSSMGTHQARMQYRHAGMLPQ